MDMHMGHAHAAHPSDCFFWLRVDPVVMYDVQEASKGRPVRSEGWYCTPLYPVLLLELR